MSLDTFVGTRVGSLVVLEATKERKHESIVYICQCDCGNQIKRSRRHLNSARKSGAMSDCGCNHHQRQQLVGQKMGLLSILEWAGDVDGKPCYVCDCDCGKKAILIPMSRIKSSKNASCGCHTKVMKTANFSKDISGQRFGNLVAVKPLEDKRNWRYRVWLCTCDCDNTREATVGELSSGNTRSCSLDCVIRKKERRKYRATATDPERRRIYFEIRSLLLEGASMYKIMKDLHVGESPIKHIKDEMIAEGAISSSWSCEKS